jgi:hypothetical protein
MSNTCVHVHLHTHTYTYPSTHVYRAITGIQGLKTALQRAEQAPELVDAHLSEVAKRVASQRQASDSSDQTSNSAHVHRVAAALEESCDSLRKILGPVYNSGGASKCESVPALRLGGPNSVDECLEMRGLLRKARVQMLMQGCWTNPFKT